jgi:hypothetical protein
MTPIKNLGCHRRATQDLKAEAEERWNLQEKLHLQDQEEIKLIATHPKEIDR